MLKTVARVCYLIIININAGVNIKVVLLPLDDSAVPCAYTCQKCKIYQAWGKQKHPKEILKTVHLISLLKHEKSKTKTKSKNMCLQNLPCFRKHLSFDFFVIWHTFFHLGRAICGLISLRIKSSTCQQSNENAEIMTIYSNGAVDPLTQIPA